MVTSFFPGKAYKKDLPSLSIFTPKVTTPGTSIVQDRSDIEKAYIPILSPPTIKLSRYFPSEEASKAKPQLSVSFSGSDPSTLCCQMDPVFAPFSQPFMNMV